MRTNYDQAIGESDAELRALEHQHRGQRTAVRIQVLRLLKSGQVRSLRAAAPVVGYTYRQLQTWWRQYTTDGLDALVQLKPHRGKRSQLTEEVYAALEQKMLAGEIATLKDAQTYLSQEWGIVYRSLNGVWLQLRKRRVKLKTGRRRHRKADAAAQAAFKETSGTS